MRDLKTKLAVQKEEVMNDDRRRAQDQHDYRVY
jgi:hypothetical protein